ncbi:MAG: amino acid ABC transporter permease [Syntrophomonadaceae bacterium]
MEIRGFEIVWTHQSYFLVGALLTLKITVLSITFGLILGLILALLKMSSFKLGRFIAVAYIDFFRGTPLFVQILFLYFGVLPMLNITGNVTAAIVACSLNSAAYVAEIIRAGIQAVDKGQMEAARSLGMTNRQAMVYVILPQAFKIVIPPMINEFIMLLKDTSLVSVIAAEELTHRGKLLYSTTYEAVWIWGAVCVIYLIMTKILSILGDYVERRLATE